MTEAETQNAGWCYLCEARDCVHMLARSTRKRLESTYQSRLLLEAPKTLPDLRLFRRQIMSGVIDGRRMSAGIAGQSDVYGFWRGGRAVELELKGPTGNPTPAQKVWREFCLAWGIPHLVLKPQRGESVDETVGRWLREIATSRA